MTSLNRFLDAFFLPMGIVAILCGVGLVLHLIRERNWKVLSAIACVALEFAFLRSYFASSSRHFVVLLPFALMLVAFSIVFLAEKICPARQNLLCGVMLGLLLLSFGAKLLRYNSYNNPYEKLCTVIQQQSFPAGELIVDAKDFSRYRFYLRKRNISIVRKDWSKLSPEQCKNEIPRLLRFYQCFGGPVFMILKESAKTPPLSFSPEECGGVWKMLADAYCSDRKNKKLRLYLYQGKEVEEFPEKEELFFADFEQCLAPEQAEAYLAGWKARGFTFFQNGDVKLPRDTKYLFSPGMPRTARPVLRQAGDGHDSAHCLEISVNNFPARVYWHYVLQPGKKYQMQYFLRGKPGSTLVVAMLKEGNGNEIIELKRQIVTSETWKIQTVPLEIPGAGNGTFQPLIAVENGTVYLDNLRVYSNKANSD